MLDTAAPVSPVAQAPPDRPTMTIEQWAQMGIALLFGDNVFDMHERKIVYDLMKEIQLRSQTGGIGMGNGTPSTQPPEQAQAPSDAGGAEGDPNATEDYGTVAGAEPQDDEGD